MSRAELASAARSWMALWDNGRLENFENLHAVDFKDRSAAGRHSDRWAFREGISELYRAFPDFRAKETLVAIDDAAQIVTIRWTARGTHEGRFMDIAPTHQIVSFEGIEIIRCHAGKIIERWGEWNGIEILQHIKAGGFKETPEGAAERAGDVT